MRCISLCLSLVLLSNVACRADQTTSTTKQPQGQAPIAEAGIGGTFSSDQAIFLNGEASSDPDDDEITFVWSFVRTPSGSTLTTQENVFHINNSTNPETSFLADTAGTYIVQLVVTDSTGLSSEPDTVIISVEQGQLPLANAGIDQYAVEGQTVALNGSQSSDVLGRNLNYNWSLTTKPAGSASTMLNSTAQMASFVPDVSGQYLVSLIVNNGVNDSVPDVAIVEVSAVNPLAPVAVTGEDMLDQQDCTHIQLDGTGSYDPNGDTIEYVWSVQSKPADSHVSDSSFSDKTSPTPTFYPDVSGDYVVSLAVYDGALWSIPTVQQIFASERISNNPPTLNVGGSLTSDAGTANCSLSGYSYVCDECSPVQLNIGTNATISDADGDPVSYEWYVITGDVVVADPTSVSTSAVFSGATPTAPNACESTVYDLELVAQDCPGATSVDALTVTLTCCGVEGQ